MPERLDLNNYPDWLVEKAADIYVRTKGRVLKTPKQILSYPPGWEDAVKKYANIIIMAKPSNPTQGETSA